MNNNSVTRSPFVLSKENIVMLLATISIFLAQITEKTGSSIPIFVGYLTVLFCALIANKNILFYLILFLLSDNSIFDIGGISIQLLLMATYIVKYILIREGHLYRATAISSMLLALYSFVYIEGGFGTVLLGFKLALTIIYFTDYFRRSGTVSYENYTIALRFAVWGIIVSIVAAIVVDPSLLLSGRIALSADSNWNLLGILASLLFSHSLLMYFNSPCPDHKYLVYCVAMVGSALISTSRTAFLVIVASVVWAVLIHNRRRSDLYKKGFFIVLVVFAVIFIFSGVIHISFVDQLIDRFVNPRQGDMSNGRFDLWTQYIYALSHDSKLLIFGQGSPLIEGISMINTTKSLVAHNMYIEQLVMYGVIGNIVVILMYLYSNRGIKSGLGTGVYDKPHYRYYLNIVLIFAIGMVSHLLTSVIVTTELYLGIMQYYVLSMNDQTR